MKKAVAEKMAFVMVLAVLAGVAFGEIDERPLHPYLLCALSAGVALCWYKYQAG